MTDRELMQKALEALEPYAILYGHTALRERLAQPETVMAEYKHQTYAAYKTDGEMKIGVVPEQEPVALETIYDTIICWDETDGKRSRRELARRIIALYTTPPRREWVGLTDEELHGVIRAGEYDSMEEFARAIEAKLREKNQ